MKILVVGFQRSGTTLLRRIIEMHPEVEAVFHERFLLKKFRTRNSVIKHAVKSGCTAKGNWGEKTPYYPNIRKINTMKYCHQWQDYFHKESRIVHIVRHPFDVAASNVKKFNCYFNVPIRMYCTHVPVITRKIDALKNSVTVKYEDLLIHPEIIIPKLYDMCNLNPDVDWEDLLRAQEKPQYQKLNKSRALAYKGKKINVKKDMSDVFEFMNSFGHTKYENKK